MSYAYTQGLTTLERAMKSLRVSKWCEVESSYLRELQIKATKYDRVCELLKDAIDVDVFVEAADHAIQS